MKNIYIVIPTYEPDEEVMLKFINELLKKTKNILVINDGSNKSHDQFFQNLETKGIDVITHYKNLGKGRALKNAFNYLLNKDKNIEGVVTCDCDGQHSVNDILKCAKSIIKNKDCLILGVRDFNKEIVPFKSRYGNIITRNIFKIFIGLNISDTQTGLRGINKNLMVSFLDLPGERYEYETNMLIACQKLNIKICEETIETIYLNNNLNSHFNALKDSYLIYKLFSKYFLIAFSTFILDLIIFIWLFNILNNIIWGSIIARLISFIYNYKLNYNLIYKNLNFKTKIKYYILTIIAMFISAFLVNYLYNYLNISVILIKVIVDIIISFIIIFLKRKFVFKNV